MPKSLLHALPCGCQLCGCQCEEHARPAGADRKDDRSAWLCPPHRTQSVLLTVLQEAGALVSLALFVACIAVWASVFVHG